MKLLLTYPKYLRPKVIADLDEAKKKAIMFNEKTQTGKLGKLVGFVGKKFPVFSAGLSLNYDWVEVDDTSLKLDVTMTGEGLIRPSIIVGTLKQEFQRSYGREKVRVRLLIDDGDEKNGEA